MKTSRGMKPAGLVGLKARPTSIARRSIFTPVHSSGRRRAGRPGGAPHEDLLPRGGDLQGQAASAAEENSSGGQKGKDRLDREPLQHT